MTEIVEEARVKKTAPPPSREKGERNLDLPSWLNRYLPPWRQPNWYNAEMWRYIVARQPVATICRETIISSYLSLDWKVDAKDSDLRDELRSEIDYYTDFLSHTGEYSYSEIIEWIGRDLLDLPFGGAAEIGRQGDKPEGKAMWIELIDGGTLFPTLNKDYPVGQALRELADKPVYFPWYVIDRVYISPRTEIMRKGWGLAPPEKIYLAIELINRGDVYYANLLLDTPEAGLLDLGDMSKMSAEAWLSGFKEMLTGIDGFKIPVIYEHQNPVSWIPFGRPPTDMLFDAITSKYASFIAAGYGLSLSDIGMGSSSSGGNTLAGSIREERKSRRTGFARFKAKMGQFFNFILPDTLEYKIIDQDEELSVAVGRSRLSNATAIGQLIELGVITPNEGRRMMIADGLVSISIPEDIPEDEILQPQNEAPVDERPGMLGRPIAPSEGGHGEILPRSDYFTEEIERIVGIEDIRLRRLIRAAIDPIFIMTKRSFLDMDVNNAGELSAWNDWHDDVIWEEVSDDEIPEIVLSSLANAKSRLDKVMKADKWWESNLSHETIAIDLIDIFRSAANQKLLKKSEELYESGETDYLDSHFEIDKELEQRFVGELTNLIDNLFENIPNIIKNCVISGTRKSLSSKINANKVAFALDTQEIISDNTTVLLVRREIENAGNRIIYDFAGLLSNLMHRLLEEI